MICSFRSPKKGGTSSDVASDSLQGDFGMGFAISWAKLHYYILILFYFIFFLPFISLITFQLNLCCDMKLAVSTNFTWFESSSLSLAPYSSLNFFPLLFKVYDYVVHSVINHVCGILHLVFAFRFQFIYNFL